MKKKCSPDISYVICSGLISVCVGVNLTDVKKKWENSSWGRKLIVQKRRAALNDFDRFKLMLAKIKVGIQTIFTTLPNCFFLV